MRFMVVLTLVLGSALARPPFHRGGNLYWKGSAVNKSWELAQFHLEPFSLTDMHIDCRKEADGFPLFGCSIKFNWADPNANQSCTCEDYWRWDGVTLTQGPMNNYSADYFACSNGKAGVFQFKFVHIFDLSNFSLSLTHMYKDIKNFPTPTTTNMFAQPNITLQMIETSSTTMTYSYACDCPIEANITGMTI